MRTSTSRKTEFDPSEYIKKILSAVLLSTDHVDAEMEVRLLEALPHLQAALAQSYRRCSKTKTIFSSEVPVPLNSFYEPTSLMCRGVDSINANISDLRALSSAILITGTAGAGKSTLMRHLFMQCLAKQEQIPIFFELRQLNAPTGNLFSSIAAHIFPNTEIGTSERLFRSLISTGSILFLLDGFDEIHPLQQQSAFLLLSRLPGNNWKNTWIVSSRPDSTLASLDSYAVLTVKPLTKPQSEKLVNRAPFSEHVKQRFLHEMQGDNYNTHLSFFSNPLLLSIMLVGFEDMGSIPFKRSLLYEQIFMSLYQKHDARKELFRRVLSSELPRDEFQRLLNAFGFQTYLRWSLSFKHNEVVKYIDEALHQTGIHRKRQQISTDDVLKDMLTAICILQEEGGIYEYVHKSFQEYFCCSFIKNYRGKRLPSILKMVVSDFSDISCLELLTEMCGGLLEREVMEPTIDFLLEAVPKHLAPKEAAPYLALRTHPDATVSHDGYRIFHVDVKQNHRLSRFLNWIAIYVDNPRPSRQVSTEPVSKALLLETQREILLRAIREQEDDGKTISPGFEAFHNDSRLSENERRHIGRRNTQISLPRDLLQIDPKLTDALWSSGLVDEMDVVNLYAAKEAIAATQREDDEQVDKMMNAARRERSKRHQGGEA